MLIFLLSCLFGAVCAVGVWTAVTAHTTIDDIVKRGRHAISARRALSA